MFFTNAKILETLFIYLKLFTMCQGVYITTLFNLQNSIQGIDIVGIVIIISFIDLEIKIQRDAKCPRY